MSGLAIRPMRRVELDLAIDWAAAEGWNPGLDDADAFFAADPDGFLMGFLDGEPAAAISVVAYGAAFGFLGFYICRPELRGKGHGLEIWNAGIDRLGARTIGLDGVVDQQPNYARSGFALAHRNIRFGGRASGSGLIDPAIIEITPEAPPSFADAIVAYDRPLFPGPREGFLRQWIAPTQAGGAGRRALAFLDDGLLTGYGVVRPCREGFKVGPLFADSAAVAAALFDALVAPYGGEPIFLDVPEPNDQARMLAEARGLAPVFETARMYRGRAPDLALSRIFGITTFELG